MCKGVKKDIRFFGIINYQNIIYYKKATKRPTGILIAKNGSYNDSYIIVLLCRHELARKGLGQTLLDKLLEKANMNNKKYIYVEAVSDSKKFYEIEGFIEDEHKENYTDSEKDPLTFGYLLDIQKDKINENQIGGFIEDSEDSEDIINFKIEKIRDNSFKIVVNKNNKIIGYVEMTIESTNDEYVVCEIDDISGETDENKIIVMTIFDNLCDTHYIHKSKMLVASTSDRFDSFVNVLEKSNYKKMNVIDINKSIDNKTNTVSDKLFVYVKIHNSKQFIDRTIMTY